MKTRKRTTKLLAMVAMLAMVALMWASWGARPAQAIVIVGGKTGLFGITEGQKVRISTLNAAYTRGAA